MRRVILKVMEEPQRQRQVGRARSTFGIPWLAVARCIHHLMTANNRYMAVAKCQLHQWEVILILLAQLYHVPLFNQLPASSQRRRAVTKGDDNRLPESSRLQIRNQSPRNSLEHERSLQCQISAAWNAFRDLLKLPLQNTLHRQQCDNWQWKLANAVRGKTESDAVI